MVHPDAIWYDILTCWEKNESNAAKWCLLTLNGAFWHFESNVRRHLGIQDTHHPLHFSHLMRWSVWPSRAYKSYAGAAPSGWTRPAIKTQTWLHVCTKMTTLILIKSSMSWRWTLYRYTYSNVFSTMPRMYHPV